MNTSNDEQDTSQRSSTPPLIAAARKGDVNLVISLLSRKEIQDHPKAITLMEATVREAALAGQFGLLIDLFKANHLKVKADLRADEDWLFRHTCRIGRVDIVRFATSCPDLNDHADLRGRNYEGFRFACERSHIGVIDYLLLDKQLQIPMTC